MSSMPVIQIQNLNITCIVEGLPVYRFVRNLANILPKTYLTLSQNFISIEGILHIKFDV